MLISQIIREGGMQKKKGKNGDVAAGMDLGCCAVEAIVTVDERGQMVLPKELREKAGIKAGDKLAVTSWKKDGEVCCIALIKAGNLGGMVRTLLGPVMKDLL
jgi:AbrB family looped-hinge helix DNA binding protein